MDNLTIDISKKEISIEVTKKSITIEMPNKQGVSWPDGKSAYQIALDNGFIGTEEDWLASLEVEWQFDSYPQDLALEYWIAKTL